jgi:hypothetical protein
MPGGHGGWLTQAVDSEAGVEGTEGLAAEGVGTAVRGHFAARRAAPWLFPRRVGGKVPFSGSGCLARSFPHGAAGAALTVSKQGTLAE